MNEKRSRPGHFTEFQHTVNKDRIVKTSINKTSHVQGVENQNCFGPQNYHSVN